MPGKVKVKIIAGRNLPVMDRSSDTTDAYVEVKLGNTTYKTDVCRKSLNPQWNSEWYRFEVDDSELQDEPLQIRLMDHDTYTANDFIGKVYVDLNPLLLPAASRSSDVPPSSAGGSVMAGWIPVYDTMLGIRGEVNILVKLELFSDFNKFRQSSCGVQFFCSTVIPQGYYAQTIHGFVEELVVTDDPEYQWIDKIRTPRASNEARQTLFFKLSGEIQRKIGLKALDLGGNSVIGYSQNFDLEGESGVVARGIGTAVTLVRSPDSHLLSSKERGLANFRYASPRMKANFTLRGGFGVKRVTHPLVMIHARPYNRSHSADRGRINPVLHHGPSTQSLKTDSGIISSIASKLNKGMSTGSLKASLRESEESKGLGSRAVRMLRSILPGRPRPDEELACVEEGSGSSSSSESLAPAISRPSVHSRYEADPIIHQSLDRFSFVARSGSPSSMSSSISLPESDSSEENSSSIRRPSVIRPVLAPPDINVVNSSDNSNDNTIEAEDEDFASDVCARPATLFFREYDPVSNRTVEDTPQTLPVIEVHPGTPSALSIDEPHTAIASERSSPIKKCGSVHALPRSPDYHSACKDVAVTPLHKSHSVSALVSHACAPRALNDAADELDVDGNEGSRLGPAMGPTSLGTSPSPGGALRSPAQPIHRRSSDSDLSITPKGGSLTGSERSSGPRPAPTAPRPALNQESVEMLEYPFLTMSRYPAGFIQHLGGTVSARSVKLLERITNLEEPETRDAWWTELRMEVRSHARALGCNVVVGYAETTSICDDVCVLSASGTAALISHLSVADDVFTGEQTAELDPPCSLCHVPYSENGVPFRVSLHRCTICRRGKVPDVLFTTIDLVDAVATTGKGSFIHAYVARSKRDCKGEMNAKEISDGLPFLEYDLHRLLMSKLKVKGMNAIQGLKVQISIGEKLLIGLATGTAALLTALPAPPAPKLSAGNSWKDRKKLVDMQKVLVESHQKNLDFYGLHINPDEPDESLHSLEKDMADVILEDLPDLDLGSGNKDACILEVDDAEDADIVSLLTDPRPPDGFHVVCTEGVPGLSDVDIVRNLQMFTHVWRAKIPYGHPLSSYNVHINRLLQSVVFKLRNTRPASISGLQLKVQLEQDEVQLSAVGMAVGLGEPRPDPEVILSNEESSILFKPRKHMPPRSRYGVDITPLSFVPGGTIERYLGNLNFFFIRESSCIREGGGLSGFVHNFLMEVLAVVRAHVSALGGNAMVAYFMSECFLYNYPHKNQGQCLINVGGDAVYVSYFPTSDNKPT